MEFLAKYWKKIGMLIVIIACLFNIVAKLVAKVPYMKQLEDSAQYTIMHQEDENSQK